MKFEELDRLLQAFSDPHKETIYHYTSADGILGIIDNHELWMSNAEFMNDSTELRMLKNSKDMFRDQDFENVAVRNAWENIFKVKPSMFRNDVNSYYITSFSKKKDMLEQWRGYGNYCIGFDIEKLKARRYFYLYSCIYTEDAIKNWILKNERTMEWKEVIKDKEKQWAARNLIKTAQMKYKNDNFSNEEEVRLITQSHHAWEMYGSSQYEHEPPIHFRRHPIYGFIPYVKFFIEQDTAISEERAEENEQEMKRRKLKEENSKQKELLPIKEVFIGPMAHQQEAKAACEILLKERGYKDVKVDVSKIPYRGI